jgi:hypothetical protein
MAIITQKIQHNKGLLQIIANVKIMIMIAECNRTDVSLEPIFDGTSHCKHHSDMDVPRYVFVDVPSGYY